MDISVIICTHNRSELLRKAMHGLARLIVPPGLSWEVLVIDNNSTDDTRVAVEEFQRTGLTETLYVFEGRQGKSFALNSGVAHARGRVLAFTDDDSVVDSEWLSAVSRAFSEAATAGVGGRIVQTWPAGKPAWLERLERSYPPMDVLVAFDLGDAPAECTLKTPPYGANMAFRRAAFERFGGFRTDLGPRGGGPGRVGGGSEDTEFCRRVIAAGERVLYVPRMVVEHPVEASRATQRYFLKWYFNHGRTSIRGARANGAGTPAVAYRLRRLASSAYRWTIARNADERLARRLRLYQHWGELVETLNRGN
jgi:glucosyl-dolichyl phosphate glucuronosyltransferase